jgi:hypothetical protein
MGFEHSLEDILENRSVIHVIIDIEMATVDFK